MPSKVYFTRNIAPESVLKLYEACGLELSGNVAVKLHSGEKGNQNFLSPEFWRPMIEHVHGTVVECNTAYPGSRNTTAAHWQTSATMAGRMPSPWTSWMRKGLICSCSSPMARSSRRTTSAST